MNWPRLAGALELHQVGLELNGRALLGPLDLAVAPGEIVTLMGPSGSGKSSLLALICGTLDPAFGSQGSTDRLAFSSSTYPTLSAGARSTNVSSARASWNASRPTRSAAVRSS